MITSGMTLYAGEDEIEKTHVAMQNMSDLDSLLVCYQTLNQSMITETIHNLPIT